MKPIMITPRPSQITLCEETAAGILFCKQHFDDVMLENAARKFASDGDLCVTFIDHCASEDYRAYFDDDGKIRRQGKRIVTRSFVRARSYDQVV